MKNISFNDLNDLNRILNKYSKEEQKELLFSLDNDLEVSYNRLQVLGWTITTKNGNPISGLHKVEKEQVISHRKKAGV